MGIFDSYLKNDSRTHKNLRQEFYLSNFAPYTIDKIAKLITDEGDQYLYTSQSILFEQLKFGSSQNQCFNLNGKPNFIAKQFNHVDGHDIYAYKSFFLGSIAISQLHFINDQFVFGVMTIMNNDKMLDNAIIKLLYEKYLIKVDDTHRLKSICDTDRNKILFGNLMYISLKYISGNPSHIKLIENLNDSGLGDKWNQLSDILDKFSKKI